MTRKVRKRFLIGATTTAQIIVLIHISIILFLFVFSKGLSAVTRLQTIVPGGNTVHLITVLALQAAAGGGALLGLYLFFEKPLRRRFSFFSLHSWGLPFQA